MIDKYLLEDLRREPGEKGELARWVIELQKDLDDERRKNVARSLTVKLPKPIGTEDAPAHYWDNGESMAYAAGYNKAISDAKTLCALCAAAGITLVVGE